MEVKRFHKFSQLITLGWTHVKSFYHSLNSVLKKYYKFSYKKKKWFLFVDSNGYVINDEELIYELKNSQISSYFENDIPIDKNEEFRSEDHCSYTDSTRLRLNKYAYDDYNYYSSAI